MAPTLVYFISYYSSTATLCNVNYKIDQHREKCKERARKIERETVKRKEKLKEVKRRREREKERESALLQGG